MTEPISQLGVNGYIDLLLIDRETKKVVKHIRKKNHLTEAFARWLFGANLGSIDSETRLFVNSRTGYSDSNFFKGLVSCNPISYTLGSFARLGNQCQTAGSAGEFRMILLGEKVDINASTEISPHLDSNLLSHNSRLVVYSGTYNSDDSGISLMRFDGNVTNWGCVGKNPSFTCSYMKDDEQHITIKSVLLAGDSSLGHVWVERSAPVIPANKFDATWNNRKELTTNNSTASISYLDTAPSSKSPYNISRYNQNTWDGLYLLCPFVRTETPGGGTRTTDGMYAIRQSEFYNYSNQEADNAVTSSSNSNRDSAYLLSYFDFGTREVQDGSGSSLVQTTIGPKGYFHPTASYIRFYAGGFVLGADASSNTVLFKVKPSIVSSGNTQKIQVYIANSWPTVATVTGSASDLLTIARTSGKESFTLSAPVMVPRKVLTANGYGLIDIFFTPEYGEYQTEKGYGAYTPGSRTVYGFGIHRATFDVGYYMAHKGDDSDVLAHSMTYDGCVAVLPYAIGQSTAVTSDGSNSSSSGNFNNTYCTGAYNEGIYYLPISHLFRGCKPCTWTMDETVSDKHTIDLCCTDKYQPGVMLSDKTFLRLGDYVFGHTGERRSILSTDEGCVSVVLNRTRHWQNTQSEVLSGVALDGDGIEKLSTHILVVKYTYTMEVYDTAPEEVTGATASTNQSGQIELHWTPSDATFIKLLAKDGAESEDGEFKTLVILNGGDSSYVDAGLESGQTKTYKIQGCRDACKSPSVGVTVEGESL